MKYKGWLIYSQLDAEDNSSYINWFLEEAELQSLDLKLAIRENLAIGIIDDKRTILLNNKPIAPPDFAVVRTIDPFLSLHLESMGIRVFNSSSIAQICNNKELTHHYVHGLGVPMVDTIFANSNQLPNLQVLEFPFVIKESTGRGGKQVFLIENEKDWQDSLPNLTSKTSIMQTCNVKHGKDLRVFVVGNEIVGAVLRENSRDFRANFKLGGSASLYSLSKEEVKLVQTIIEHFQFDMVGIDFLFSKDQKLLFNEIEDVVGSRTLSAVSDSNLLQKYNAYIRSQLS
ncbi:ATP-grasp domain-containing protein [Virgibacillus necropolis]|uniref:ATP-grasp domain-containing protein n=1 Tax=Virgibacillus necropolis TaxID=163877 RepID=A0A221MBS4_9BACI|nr:hypothetical protein [Virgibacillus necropolis]ASN05095.1 hypothetical protein CFK40_08765 [Virgibacillus necropolis]